MHFIFKNCFFIMKLEVKESGETMLADVIYFIQLVVQEFAMLGYMLTAAARGALEMIF